MGAMGPVAGGGEELSWSRRSVGVDWGRLELTRCQGVVELAGTTRCRVPEV